MKVAFSLILGLAPGPEKWFPVLLKIYEPGAIFFCYFVSWSIMASKRLGRTLRTVLPKWDRKLSYHHWKRGENNPSWSWCISCQPPYSHTSTRLHQTESKSNQKSATSPVYQAKFKFRLIQVQLLPQDSEGLGWSSSAHHHAANTGPVQGSHHCWEVRPASLVNTLHLHGPSIVDSTLVKVLI